MTEHYPSTDPFDAFEQMLADDPKFAASMAEATAQMEENAQRAELIAAYPKLFDKTRPYYEENIDHIGGMIHDEFARLCRQYGIDLSDPNLDVATFDDVQQELALFVYGLKRELWYGDTVAASSALVVDLRRDEDDSMGVVGIAEVEAVVGAFGGPVIGPLPDDVHAMTLGESGDPAIGIGLVLEQPIVVDETGEAHHDAFEGKQVIVALGTIGLKLQKIVYRDKSEL